MVRRSYFDRAVIAVMVGGGLFSLSPIACGSIGGGTAIHILGIALGAIIGVALARFLGLRRGPNDVKEIPTSKTDTELKELLAKYDEGDLNVEPAVDWMMSMDVPVPFGKPIDGKPLKIADLKDLVIDAGFRDNGKQPLVPELFHARSAIDRAEKRLMEADENCKEESSPGPSG